MTMHHVGIAIAQDRLTKPAFQRAVINAEMFTPQGAVVAGFLDLVVAPERLLTTAREVAQQMKMLNMTAHKNTKLKVRKALLDTLDAAITLDKTISLM
jgi:enoyl-CoA hydratase